MGGANAAGQAALYFSRYVRSVTLLVHGPSLDESMSQYLIDQITATPRINVLTSTRVVEVKGETNLEAITITNTETFETQVLPTTALFVCIGAMPQTGWLAGLVERDEHGYILSGLDMLHAGIARQDGRLSGTRSRSRPVCPVGPWLVIRIYTR